IFDLVKQVRNAVPDVDENGESISQDVRLESQLQRVQEEISDGTSNDLSEKTLSTLLEATESQLKIAREATTNAVYEVMSKRVSIRDLDQAKQEVSNQIVISTVSNNLYE